MSSKRIAEEDDKKKLKVPNYQKSSEELWDKF